MVHKDNFFLRNNPVGSGPGTIRVKGRLLDFDTPRIMGVVNLTPDSFYRPSRVQNKDDLLSRVGSMIEKGADFIDIGAYSSRPGATHISEEEELTRLQEPAHLLRKTFPDIVLSVDTFRSGVARAMVENEGIDMVNDISAGQMDDKMFGTVAELQVPYIMMHMQGTPQNMQQKPVYRDLIKELILFFSEKLQTLHLAGVNDIIADPGFGFGKTLEHNYTILANFDVLKMLEVPLMAGISRKSMIYKLLDKSPDESLTGTTAAHVLALMKGANILRVHDVDAARDAIRIVQKTMEREEGRLIK